MKIKIKKIILLLFIFIVTPCFGLRANDSATEVATGGLTLKKEPRISMEKEDLLISPDKVKVAYVFKNNSDENIQLDVAFPVPDYGCIPDTIIPSFSEFSVQADTTPVPYKIETKATFNGQDITEILQSIRKENLDHFFGFDISHEKGFEPPLSDANYKKLQSLNLLDDIGAPKWVISKKYYWKQIFPAHKEVKIIHEYPPYQGYQYYSWDERKKLEAQSCVSERQIKEIYKGMSENDNLFRVRWVKYILTTANNWQTPIKNFHLTLDYPGNYRAVGICLDSKNKKISGKKIEILEKDFIPKSEITAYFISAR